MIIRWMWVVAIALIGCARPASGCPLAMEVLDSLGERAAMRRWAPVAEVKFERELWPRIDASWSRPAWAPERRAWSPVFRDRAGVMLVMRWSLDSQAYEDELRGLRKARMRALRSGACAEAGGVSHDN